jgi:hypothetical protein
VEPNEIFDLIIRADDAVKYATEDKMAVRAEQARRLLVQARDEARAIGNEALVRQAERRLADLDALPLATPTPAPPAEPASPDQESPDA